MNRRRELDELFLSLFSEMQLRHFLRYLPDGDAVEQSLPGRGASFAVLASAATEELDARGLVDDTFFDALLKERPRRKADIGQVAQLWRHEGADPSPPDTRAGEAEGSGRVKILFLTANPTNTTALGLSREAKRIKALLRGAEHRELFTFVREEAVGVADLSSHLMRHQPTIVHFSGHGSDVGEIFLEDAAGEAQTVSASALADLFDILKDNIRVVVLNACYSAVQAQAIVDHIECVVGMDAAVPDAAAIEFAAKFYEALAFGRSVEVALKVGKLQIKLAGAGDPNLAVLHTRAGLDPATLVLASA